MAGGANIIALFGQWGLEQLLVALIGWVVLVRYRVLVPLMIGLAFLEQLGRFGVGQLKPIEAAGTPPGAIGTWILLPLTLLFFVVSVVGRPGSEDRMPGMPSARPCDSTSGDNERAAAESTGPSRRRSCESAGP